LPDSEHEASEGKSTSILYPDLDNPSNFVSDQELHDSESSGDENEESDVIDEEKGDESMSILDPNELKDELSDDEEE